MSSQPKYKPLPRQRLAEIRARAAARCVPVQKRASDLHTVAARLHNKAPHDKHPQAFAARRAMAKISNAFFEAGQGHCKKAGDSLTAAWRELLIARRGGKR
jgi:hypothetical protein